MHRVGICFAIMLSVLVASACTGPLAGNSTAPTPTHEFRFGLPVENQADALIAAGTALRGTFDYAEPLSVVSTEQTTWGEYGQRFGAGSDRPADLKIWLVIYFDRQWQAHTSDSAAPAVPAYSGCVVVVIDAKDASSLEVGGPLRKGIIAACDK